MSKIEINKDTYYIGCSRNKVLFENMYDLDDGMMFNSYAIIDEKTAIFDGAEVGVIDEYIANVKDVLNGKSLDYLIIQHMEPDHTASLKKLLGLYPNVTVVMNAKTQKMFNNFKQSRDFKGNVKLVQESDILDLGKHKLKFIFAPMVHWPEVMMTYDEITKTIYTADAFGAFGSQKEHTGSDKICDDSTLKIEHYIFEMREYYSNIVGKYGVQVQTVLKKLAQLDIQCICSLHGVVVKKNIQTVLDKYMKWSSYTPESDGILIVYGSMYGNTKEVAEKVETFIPKNVERKIYDLSDEFLYTIVGDAFKYKHIILAAPTYNGTVFPMMGEFLNKLSEFNMQNRKFAIVENGTWGPVAGRVMKERVSALKNCEVRDKVITINSSMTSENVKELEELVKELSN